MVNMSVWESVDALWDFVYASDHLAVMRRRQSGSSGWSSSCAWWVPAGHPRVPWPRSG